jgi:hypothetical protein
VGTVVAQNEQKLPLLRVYYVTVSESNGGGMSLVRQSPIKRQQNVICRLIFGSSEYKNLATVGNKKMQLKRTEMPER